jgi:hypothetical protein
VPAIAVYSIGYLVGRFAMARRHDGINYRLLYFHFTLLLSVYERLALVDEHALGRTAAQCATVNTGLVYLREEKGGDSITGIKFR